MLFTLFIIFLVASYMFNAASGNGFMGCLAAIGIFLFALFVIAVCVIKYGVLMG